HDPGNGLEGFRVAEEPGDADEHVLVEGVQLARLVPQLGNVLFDAPELAHRDPALDAAAYGRRLVVREVDAALVAQHTENGLFARLQSGDRFDAPFGKAAARRFVGESESFRHFFGPEHVIDRARVLRGERHAVELCGILALGEYDPAQPLDLDEAARTIR